MLLTHMMARFDSIGVHQSANVKAVKTSLENAGVYDSKRRVSRLPGGMFALPITPEGVAKLENHANEHGTLPEPWSNCVLLNVILPPSKKALNTSGYQKLKEAVDRLLDEYGVMDKDSLLAELPNSWERHGDLVVLSQGSFSTALVWRSLGDRLWQVVCKALGCLRVALNKPVMCDKYRTSSVQLVYGLDGWVEHVDNGVAYVFDVTRCMFSAGNVTEKLRLARLDCSGETVVDLYAGVGYFTLPLLVHARAKSVHACEWNPDAVEGLRRGLRANAVEDRCIIHFGDCRQVAPRGIAERVNLGLLPSSEGGWFTACAALRADTGGWMHVHGNVSSKPGALPRTESNKWEEPLMAAVSERGHVIAGGGEAVLSCSGHVQEESSRTAAGKREGNRCWLDWASYVAGRMQVLLSECNGGTGWTVEVRHLEHVKSYAPHVDHLVVDLECRPAADLRLKGNLEC